MHMWDRLRKYVSGLWDHPSQPQSDSQRDKPGRWGHFQELLEELEEAGEQALQDQHKDERQAAPVEEERRQIERLQGQMREDILHTHAQLGTGLEAGDLERMSEALHAHCEQFLVYRNHNDHLTNLVLFAVWHRFHLEARERGWCELNARMQRSNSQWPPPTGVTPSADEKELAHAREMQLEQLHEAFLATRMRQFAQLMLGVVPVWRAAYPERGGPLWTSTVLRGVGAALASRHHERILHAAQAHQDAWERLVAEKLSHNLRDIRDHLAGGVSSIAEAATLTDQAERICRETIPDLVWDFVEPRVEQPASV